MAAIKKLPDFHDEIKQKLPPKKYNKLIHLSETIED